MRCQSPIPTNVTNQQQNYYGTYIKFPDIFADNFISFIDFPFVFHSILVYWYTLIKTTNQYLGSNYV